jgi:hypothetical protein
MVVARQKLPCCELKKLCITYLQLPQGTLLTGMWLLLHDFLCFRKIMVGERYLLVSTYLSSCNNLGIVERILIKINTLQLQQNTCIHSSNYYSRTRMTVVLYEGLQTSLHASTAQGVALQVGRSRDRSPVVSLGNFFPKHPTSSCARGLKKWVSGYSWG